MAHSLSFPYQASLAPNTAPHHQFMTSSPATSPNISVSGSNMSPICSEEGPSVSPPLPPRVPASLGGMERVMPTSLASSMPDSSQFLPDPSSLAQHLTGAYPRLPMPGLASSLPGLASGMPGLPYSSSEQSPYSSISMENFYSPLANPYSIKEGCGGEMPSAWGQSLQGGALGSAPYSSYPYDTSSLAAYGYGGAYGLAATRKNVTRESTATLKAWLNEHKKNPYPTKGEKIMLAIISKMTLTQVSCWFANARRRLKKENKMTWEPKNGLNDEDVDVSDEDEGDNSFNREDKPNALEHEDQRSSWMVEGSELGSGGGESKDGIPLPPTKPRIWSMAELAVSKSSYVGCG